MTGDDIGNVIYLVLLGAVVGSYFLVSGRKQMGKTAQQAAIWGLIFVGVIAGYGLWSDIQRAAAPRQTVYADERRVEVPRADDGHYYLTLTINDTPINFVVDTGASDMVLTQRDSQRVGIDAADLKFLGQASTANGIVTTARVRLNTVELGPFYDANFRASVNGGDMDTSLLGMAYLQNFERIEFSRGMLILSR